MFDPLVHGVIEKTTDSVLQTNLMWAKDLNEIAAQIAQGLRAARARDRGRDRALYASHFTEQELKEILTFYQIAARQENADRRSRRRSTRAWPMPAAGATSFPTK